MLEVLSHSESSEKIEVCDLFRYTHSLMKMYSIRADVKFDQIFRKLVFTPNQLFKFASFVSGVVFP
jgi:hypothetical protein